MATAAIAANAATKKAGLDMEAAAKAMQLREALHKKEQQEKLAREAADVAREASNQHRNFELAVQELSKQAGVALHFHSHWYFQGCTV